jgi:HK97 family phage portal protein
MINAENTARWEAARNQARSFNGSRVLRDWMAQGGAQKNRGVRNDMSMADFSTFVQGFENSGRGAISPATAMNQTAVYACVALIGGAISSIPLRFYRRNGNDRTEYIPDEWWMLNEEMCPAWPSAVGWEFGTQSLLLRGDLYFRIKRASKASPKIVGFEPYHPSTVVVRRVEDRLVYDVTTQPQLTGTMQTTSVDVKRETIDQDDMIHVPGPGFNGLNGLPQISSVLKTSGSIAMSAEEYNYSFFKNSARPDFVLQTEGVLTNDQVENLRAQVLDAHQGVGKAWKPLVLQAGLEAKPITLTAQELQMMEVRKFGIEEICRAFGVPPFMVGHTEKSSSWGTGVEQMGIGFVKYTLQRHLVKIEQEINRKVFRTARNFCEFDTSGLERGDIKTRFDAYRVALGRAGEQPWMDYSEVRERENLKQRTDLVPNVAAPTTPGGSNAQPTATPSE